MSSSSEHTLDIHQ